MEYTQWDMLLCSLLSMAGLNPCCNGIYSMRDMKFLLFLYQKVLILVVMEYTQWVVLNGVGLSVGVGLNPCCNGIYSMS